MKEFYGWVFIQNKKHLDWNFTSSSSINISYTIFVQNQHPTRNKEIYNWSSKMQLLINIGDSDKLWSSFLMDKASNSRAGGCGLKSHLGWKLIESTTPSLDNIWNLNPSHLFLHYLWTGVGEYWMFFNAKLSHVNLCSPMMSDAFSSALTIFLLISLTDLCC